jgi:hypothetical protein
MKMKPQKISPAKVKHKRKLAITPKRETKL